MHDGYPSFIRHEYYEIKECILEVVEVLRRVLPLKTQIETVLLCIDSIIVLCQLNVAINHTSVERALKDPHSENGENYDDYLR